MSWKAFNDSMALRELAGIRGVSPSVRFKYEFPGSNGQEKIYHVPLNEKIYIWGVELFSDGYDCISIKFINESGVFYEVKPQGGYVDYLKGNKSIEHNSVFASITEHLPFDDFWEDPFLVKSTDHKILKNNFFRCFEFKDEGIYRIDLDETSNPKYRSKEFYPIDYSSSEEFDNNSTIYGPIVANNINSDLDCEFRRTIYIKVISRSNDICNQSSLTNIVLDVQEGRVNLGDSVNFSNYRINEFKENQSYKIIGKPSFFVKDNFNSSYQLSYYLIDSQSDSSSVSLSDLIEFEEDYYPVFSINEGSVTSFSPNNKALYCRNLYIENCNFLASSYAWSHMWTPPQYKLSSSINYVNSGKGPVYDFRGSTFRNCKFSNGWHGGDIGSQNFDGATFENCIFENCGLVFRSSGMLFKNCTFEGCPRTSIGDEITWKSGECNCVMGCVFKGTGRVSLFQSWQPIFNNIYIKNSVVGVDFYQIAGELFVCERAASAVNSGFLNNINILNNYTNIGLGNFMGFWYVLARSNLCAFNSASVISSDWMFSNGQVQKFNVWMHNFSSNGGGVYMRGNVYDNRFLNCVWQNPNFSAFSSAWRNGDFFYGQSSFIEVGDQDAQLPSRNLLNNCSIVDYYEFNYFFGYPSWNNPGSQRPKNFIIVNKKDDYNLLSEEKNIIVNLRKIIRAHQ